MGTAQQAGRRHFGGGIELAYIAREGTHDLQSPSPRHRIRTIRRSGPRHSDGNRQSAFWKMLIGVACECQQSAASDVQPEAERASLGEVRGSERDETHAFGTHRVTSTHGNATRRKRGKSSFV